MEISIGQAIHLLLVAHRAVSVPDLGTFSTDYKPASIDHVNGIIRPPSKFVSFEPSVDSKNTILTDYLVSRYPDATRREITEAIAEFVDSIRNHPETTSVVEVADLGRFYKNFENKIQFVSDFNESGRENPGLPDLKFHPVDRRSPEEPASQSVSADSSKSTPKEQRSNNLYKLLPWAFGFLLLISASGIYYKWKTKTSPSPAETARINETPDRLEETYDEFANPKSDPEVSEIEKNAETAAFESEEADNSQIPDTDAASLPPGVRQCVIIIGAYSTKEGANAAVKKLVDLGFAVFRDKRRGMTRVGARMLYENEQQVSDALTFLRREFDPDAFILEK